MLNSTFPHESFSGRSGRRLVATAFLSALLSLGFGLGTAFAQDQDAAPSAPAQQSGEQSEGMGRHMGHRQMPSVDDQVKNLSEKLNLTEDQQAKLKPILEDQRAQFAKIRDDSSLSREDQFGKMRELRQSSDAQIKSVLNEDQQKNYDKMREERRGRMKQWRKGGRNAPPAGGSPDNQQ